MNVNEIHNAIIDMIPVLSTVEGRFRGFASTSYVTLEVDDELYVTAQARGAAVWVNVRKDGGPVIRLNRDSIRPIDASYRSLGQVPEGAISPTDPGLAWLWIDAARVAAKSGHCRQYDDLCDQLGIPGREREFEIDLKLSDEVVIRGKVTARSRKLAEELLRQQIATAALS